MTTRRSHPRLVRKLKEALGPDLCARLEEATVVELMLNPDGRLFVERLGEGMQAIGQMSASAAEIVIGSVAHALGQEVDIDRPIVSGELPIGGHRFEGLLPPVVAGPTFSIRRRASRLIPLSAYVASGAMSKVQHEALTRAIAARRNIVVAGGTGSGKTTLTNSVIAEMVRVAPEHRLVILEDTVEIRCEAENAVSLRTSDTVDMGLLLKSTLRLRPDRIIVGEVRDGAALTLLKAWNTGHPGGITTVHANDAAAALVRLEQLTAEVSPRPMREVIGEAVDLVVGIERTASGRRIRELLEVEGHADGRWITRPIATEDRPHVA